MKNTVLLTVVCACGLYAQGRGPTTITMTADLLRQYEGIKNNLTKAAEEMPEDGYTLQPNKDERTFGAWVAHVADAQAGGCSSITGERKNIGAASKTAKADLMAALKESFDLCDAAFAGTSDDNVTKMVSGFAGQIPRASALYGVIIHSNECYGNMAVYMRLKNLVPPSTEAQQAGRAGRGKKKE